MNPFLAFTLYNCVTALHCTKAPFPFPLGLLATFVCMHFSSRPDSGEEEGDSVFSHSCVFEGDLSGGREGFICLCTCICICNVYAFERNASSVLELVIMRAE